MNRFSAGIVAGAVGTLALEVTTYLDMAVRGRAASDVPADTVARTAERLGIEPLTGDEPKAAHRRSGVGALLGYGTGVAFGLLYGIARPGLRRPPTPLAGLALGAAAMVGANAGAIAAGTTDPRQWGIEGWLADIVPHVAFGLAAAVVGDVLLEARRA